MSAEGKADFAAVWAHFRKSPRLGKNAEQAYRDCHAPENGAALVLIRKPEQEE